MCDLYLPSGLTVPDPEGRLDLFLQEEWTYYDAISDDRPDELTVIDVLAPVFVNAYFRCSAATLRAVHRDLAAACNGLLPLLSVSADLLAPDAPLDLVRDLLAAAVSVRGVLVPVATKVLFRKRRDLIPILDNEVIGHYARALGQPALVARSQDQNVEVVADVALTVLRAFREDLFAGRERLCSLSERTARRGVLVGPVRALEILVWTEVERRGYYRQ